MATYIIKSGHQLTITTDALTSGSYYRAGDSDNTKTAPTSFSVSSTTVLGPFTNDQRYEIDYNGTGITITDIFTDLSVIGNLTGTQAEFLDDLANDANGTAIATFANAIRDALIAAGIMASE